jgi:hypothetical protein
MLTCSFSGQEFPPQSLIETVRSADDPQRLQFAIWDGSNVTLVPHIERGGEKIFPQERNTKFLKHLRLPIWPSQHREPGDLFNDLGNVISDFIDLSPEALLLVRAQILVSAYPHSVDVAPYLWLVGPFASGKSTLLRLLQCLCRRAILVADVRAGSLHKYIDDGKNTLLLDEFELDKSRNRALIPLLRAGSMPGAFIANGNGLDSVYGPKIFASRQPPPNIALASRSLVVRMFRTRKTLRKLDTNALDTIAAEFQPRLLMFRFMNSVPSAVGNVSSPDLEALTLRTRDLAIALTTPLHDKAEAIARLLAILKEHDDELIVEQCLEPEWLTIETLFASCHDHRINKDAICESTVGGISSQLNLMLERRGENLKFTARKIGSVLRGLGIRPIPFGNMGNGLLFTSVLKRQIHQLARQFGIDRRTIGLSGGLEAGYGGRPCALCEELGLTAGLRFVDANPGPRPKAPDWSRPRLFDPAYKKVFATSEASSKKRTS